MIAPRILRRLRANDRHDTSNWTMTIGTMRNVLVTVTVIAATLSGCTQRSVDVGSGGAAATKPAAPVAASPSPYQPAATFQEIMDSVVDPSSDYIWHAVSSGIDAKGLYENKPRNAAQWHEFRRRAIALAEAANLIAVPGRRVARGDRTAESNEPLPIAEIQGRLDRQHDQLVGFAAALRDVSMKLVDAADRQDVAAVTDLGGTLDDVCEACHLVFWYPPQSGSPSAAPAQTPAKP
jgi:hypothetical protein